VLRRVIAGFLALHGFAHLVGFLAAWRLGEYADAPHATLILNGTLDVGDVGIATLVITGPTILREAVR
jgi:hypothetical protein